MVWSTPQPQPQLLLFLYATTGCILFSMSSRHALVDAATAAAAPFSFSFNFSRPSTYSLDDLRFEGDATLGLYRDIVDLTCTTPGQAITNNCTGRMTYNQPVRFYDNVTGEVASFSTRFTFAIKSYTGNSSMADGMAFFLSGYPSRLPLGSGGGFLGLDEGRKIAVGSDRYIAVEFDTYSNLWDPIGTRDHIGIDINSVTNSHNTTSLPNSSLNSTMTASISFNSTTKMLIASLQFDDRPSLRPAQVSLLLPNDVTALLPSEVAVGFSAATGVAFELHHIMSWSFSSTLTNKPQKTKGTKHLAIILPTVLTGLAAISLCMWCMCRKKRWSRSGRLPLQPDHHTIYDLETVKSNLLSLSSIQAATNNFDQSTKLGEGGFGGVYKGVLISGQEVAVKRLSKGSNQGIEEVKNELILVAKLHHKNLVQLVGFCLEEGERLLVYEYMPNKSLDTILFDPEEKSRLNWVKRLGVIEGVARGLQYLHEDSQEKIVHRDLKASNVLLDASMHPKIGDFGLAKLFSQDQTRDVTSHIAGTFGYMAPEYVMCGRYSTKSDVFSFGILVVEIVTGLRNSGSYSAEQNDDVISTVWRHWEEGTIMEMIDDSLGRNYPVPQVIRCLNIALLCLQQNPLDRPTMLEIMVMLDINNNDATTSLPVPARPTFFIDESLGYSHPSSTVTHSYMK